MTSIFICHASEDKATAEPIQLALANAGYMVFYDERSLPPGGDYQDRIHKAIFQCDLFIFLISPASIARGKYTLTELKFANERWPSPVNKVLPVNLQSISTQDIPPYLTATTILSISGNAAAETRAAATALIAEQRKNKRKQLIKISIAAGFVALTLSVAFIRIQAPSPPAPLLPQQTAQYLPMTGTILMQSDPGDYIGDGKKYIFNNTNGKLTATATANAITVNFNGDESWSLEFAAPEGESLVAGKYNSAQRAAFHNPVKPGIDISGAGRGCNTLTGQFTIREIKFSKPDELRALGVDFEQHCENAKPSLHGSIDVVGGKK